MRCVGRDKQSELRRDLAAGMVCGPARPARSRATCGDEPSRDLLALIPPCQRQ